MPSFKHLAAALPLLGLLAACQKDAASPEASLLDTLAPPTAISASALDQTIELQFSPPASTGLYVVTGYRAICADGGQISQAESAQSPIRLTGLSNWHDYTCRLQALASEGDGQYSEAQVVRPAEFNMSQTLSDGAQKTTLAFAGLAMMTGNLQSQSFFPPGKVADYTGFQYLRDNDPDRMGHNTSFLTRVAYNVLYILNDSQLAALRSLASRQASTINQYGYQRFALMKAFRRLLEQDLPTGTTGLSTTAVVQASRTLYALDGEISYERAEAYADILLNMSSSQKAYLDAMKGKGWSQWPAIGQAQLNDRLRGLSQTEAVAVMTYAGDLFSWYAGNVDGDVYFCPERHGTYFGSFYMKDAPAIGHEGYSINEQLTATAGTALLDTAQGYVNSSQATQMASLVSTQRSNLYAGSLNIVQLRTRIARALRSLLLSTNNNTTARALIHDEVQELSLQYGELDGQNNAQYALTFAQIYQSMDLAQKQGLNTLRQSILTGSYSDGSTFDFTVGLDFYLYAAPISDLSLLQPYTANTDAFFE